ncbi:MAG: O-antigen ligase C-terminal domain-containing protein [Ramlibacter sp.]|nr:O-antigen ligase C-terminal domain-containing protein [Ramlibacter sp.]
MNASTLLRFSLFICLLLPWINSRATGPSSSVEPWLISALCTALAYGLWRPRMASHAVSASLALLAAWTIARTGIAPETLAVAGACLMIALTCALGAAGARDEALLRVIAFAWLAAALLSTVFALLQYFGAADAFAPLISTTTAGEAFANLRQRNQFASLTVIGMATLFWLAPRHLPWRFAFAAIVFLAFGNAATTSRTGLVEMCVLAVLAFAWPGASRERRVLWAGGLAAYVIAAVALPSLLDLVTGTSGNRLWERVASVDSCSSRRVLWSNVLHLIAQRPWIGWGWGELDYAHYYNIYDGARFCDILDNAHNLPLHLAVELGTPASLLFCAGTLFAAWRARPWAESDPARQMAWTVLAVLALHSMVEYPLWYGPFEMAAGLALGLLVARREEPLEEEDAVPAVPVATSLLATSHIAAPLIATLAVAACLYSAWDYRRISQVYLGPDARVEAYRDDPMAQARNSWLFRAQARFAELTLTDLALDNKGWMFENSEALLHYSPEPRIIEKVIESATLTDRTDIAVGHLARLRAAFPDAYEAWSKAKR